MYSVDSSRLDERQAARSVAEGRWRDATLSAGLATHRTVTADCKERTEGSIKGRLGGGMKGRRLQFESSQRVRQLILRRLCRAQVPEGASWRVDEQTYSLLEVGERFCIVLRGSRLLLVRQQRERERLEVRKDEPIVGSGIRHADVVGMDLMVKYMDMSDRGRQVFNRR